MSDDWTRLLDDADGLTDVYSTAPALEHCKLNYLHFDERGTSATLGLSTDELPDRPLPEWGAKPYNSLTFYLVCESITELSLNGWEYPTPALQLAPAKDGVEGVRVAAEDERSSLHFTARAVHVGRLRTALVSETAI